MGFNISGIVVNKNYEGNTTELGDNLGLSLTSNSEITYEEAAKNWKEDGICDIYFHETGTLLYLSMDRCTEGYAIPGQKVLTFALSETSMAFSLNYYENDHFVREIMEFDGDRVTDEGDPLPQEATDSDVSELIFTMIGDVLGTRFWDIDFAAKAFRYTF